MGSLIGTMLAALDPDVEWIEPDLDALPYQGVTKGADEVARQVFEAVRDDKFYIFPAQEGVLASVRTRMEDIIDQRNPTMAM